MSQPIEHYQFNMPGYNCLLTISVSRTRMRAVIDTDWHAMDVASDDSGHCPLRRRRIRTDRPPSREYRVPTVLRVPQGPTEGREMLDQGRQLCSELSGR
jgi:hypothetical protein